MAPTVFTDPRRSGRSQAGRNESTSSAISTNITAPKVTKPNARKPKDKKPGLRRPRQSPDCRLLSLPGELRNHIYRFAVLEPKTIDVTSHSPPQPRFLNVCRSMRKEAGSIYYEENRFIFRVQRYNGAEFAPFKRAHDKLTGSPEIQVEIIFSGPPNWDNLVAWIKSDHHESVVTPVMEMSSNDHPDEFVVAGAFEMINALGGVSWSVKEAALKGFYLGLRGTDSAWVKAEDRVS